MAAGPSLANKVQVLFGTSLLLIVAGTLAIPWVMTDRLVFQSQSEVSRQLADAWLDSPTKLAIGVELSLVCAAVLRPRLAWLPMVALL